MIKKEALRSVVNYPLPDISLDKALIDAGLVATDQYESTDKKAIDLCAAELILVICTGPSSISEGGYSISDKDSEMLLKTRSLILNKYAPIPEW